MDFLGRVPWFHGAHRYFFACVGSNVIFSYTAHVLYGHTISCTSLGVLIASRLVIVFWDISWSLWVYMGSNMEGYPVFKPLDIYICKSTLFTGGIGLTLVFLRIIRERR